MTVLGQFEVKRRDLRRWNIRTRSNVVLYSPECESHAGDWLLNFIHTPISAVPGGTSVRLKCKVLYYDASRDAGICVSQPKIDYKNPLTWGSGSQVVAIMLQ